uniref:Uncharacterized protein n=1 Tax=Anguilla anguilla TaxID=7936 RepID=A0A0E9WDF2_ANGAN
MSLDRIQRSALICQVAYQPVIWFLTAKVGYRTGCASYYFLKSCFAQLHSGLFIDVVAYPV